ncbi:DUF1190 domain-containing protein [Roseococcus sp. SYP-B2431]|uniref:DUF1190 domain-containing protein n=1 Tax=Roseococcus sp. SYP-B2431 TaxID=2496640 RepID=UPI00103F62FE|nr:DUF1190 domain-containing protein [Roseococcus sp. SYP-B2431]TCH96670.1 DUF1190 domain-containing protein [Roseococcus sp. SYP-B2431]
MRRSHTVRLTLLAASAVALQACGDDVDTTDFVVTDVASCVARYGSEARAECEQTLGQAQQQHMASAPHYATVEECREATGGDCETTPANRPSDKTLLGAGGGSVAIPLLAGVMIGRMMDNGAGRVTTPLYAGRPPGECPPGAAAQAPGCTPRSSSSSSSGGRYYYSGTSYAGATTGAVSRGGSAAFTPSPDMARTISTGAGSAAIGRAGTGSVARGGFGASARGYSSGS